MRIDKVKTPTAIAVGVFGGATRNRTGDKGFADLCLTTWLWRQKGIGAVDEIRTRDIHLGKVALYH